MNENPSTIDSVYSEALDLQRAEKPQEAAAKFLEVLRMRPEHADALHCLGVIDARSGRFNDAERLLRKAVALEPLRANFANSLGNLLKAQGRLKEAESVYIQAIHLQPDFANAHNNLGELKLRQGSPEKAVTACYKALEINPEFASAYNNLGRAMNNLNRLEEAAAAFRRAVLIRPDFATAYNHLAHVLRAQGDIDEAIEVFEHATRLDPELAIAHFNLGVTLATVNRFEEAIESLERARQQRPRDSSTLLALGTAYHALGRHKLAAQAYRRLIDLDPESADAHLHLGLVMREQRRDDEAESAFRDALKKAPERADIHAELAALYEARNQLSEQAEMLRSGLEFDPDNVRLNIQAAKSDRRSGQYKKGIDRLASFDVTKLDPPTAEEMHFEMGHLHDLAGQTDRAFEHFVKANTLACETFRARQAKPKRYQSLIRTLQEFFEAADLTTQGPESNLDCSAPVFLVGFPRSRTKLLDAVFDRHPKIITIEEKDTLLPVIEFLRREPEGYPRALANLGHTELRKLRKIYLNGLRELAGDIADSVVIDELPLNTVHAGLIWRLFPNSKFVFSVRHPYDVILSCFMQRFAMNDAMANFSNLADAARLYDRVMSLWRLYLRKLPLTVHVIRYDETIADLEGIARGVLDFIGVDWDSAVLDYAEHARARSNLHTTTFYHDTETLHAHTPTRWRAYKKHIEPLSGLVSDHKQYFGYER